MNLKLNIDLSQETVDQLTDGRRCSESILTVYGRQFGLDEHLAMKMGCALGGGLGSCGNTCGAVIGATLILGLNFGRTHKDDIASKSNLNRIVREYIDTFKATHKSINCSELIGFDRSTVEGNKMAIESGIIKKICPGIVKNAAVILEKILLQNS